MQFCRKLYDVSSTPDDLPYGPWLRAKIRQSENMLGAKWIVQEGRPGISEELTETEEEGPSVEAGVLMTNPDPSPSSKGERSWEAQQETIPTVDFKRRRPSDSTTALHSNTQVSSLVDLPKTPASPAGQARPRP